MDFLLVERIAEYIYGENHGASVKVFCGHVYITAENFVMYHNYKDLNELLKSNTSIMATRVLALIIKFTGLDPETVKYKVHRRAVKRINNVDTPPLLAKNLKLVDKLRYEKAQGKLDL